MGGSYVLTVNASGIEDIAGNTGSGSASDTWLANDAPQLYLGQGTTAFFEGIGPKAIAPGPTLIDVDTPSFTGGKLTVSIVGGIASENLSVKHRGSGHRPNRRARQRRELPGAVHWHCQRRPGRCFATGDLGDNASLDGGTGAGGEHRVSKNGRNPQFGSPQGAVHARAMAKEAQACRSNKQVALTPVADAPVLTLPASAGYTLNNPAVLLAATAGLTDVDSPSFNLGNLRVRVTEQCRWQRATRLRAAAFID